jgi:DNA (cytosine-5)-methyltransferase 1
MIEFYNSFFKSTYKSKVNQLIIDIERLLFLEEIMIYNKDEIVLKDEYKRDLDSSTWLRINNLYNTLYRNKSKVSSTLLKFINKVNNNENAEFKFIDTFAGCGGLSLGLSNAGFKPVFINEIEPKFLESYYFNHDIDINNYYCGDIKDLSENEIFTANFANVDLIVGGPPCQGFSMANRQRLIDDPRNKLYRYFLEILKNVQPKFFIMENVKGMMNKSNEIIEDFKLMLGSDYTINITLLNAKEYGIPQNRERVFVIGSRIKNCSAQSIIDDIIESKQFFKKICLDQPLFGLPILQPKRNKNSKGLENEDIGYKFVKAKIEENQFIKEINKGREIEYISNHINRYNNDRDIEIYSRLPQGGNSLHESIRDIMPYNSRNHMFKDKYFKLKENDVCKTITSHMKMDCNMYIHPNQPRGLSPREASRVQTFPDDYIFCGANNTWYAQIGNAVPVKLAEIIGNQIMKKLKKIK